MNTKVQTILAEIQSLPPEEFRVVWQQMDRWASSRHEVMAASDPIHSARGMFTDSRLNEALLASRAEERRCG
jgi:hypothetical protein